MSQSQRQGRENASSRLSRKWTSMVVPISLRGVPLFFFQVSLRERESHSPYSWLVEWKQDSFLSTLPRGEN